MFWVLSHCHQSTVGGSVRKNLPSLLPLMDIVYATSDFCMHCIYTWYGGVTCLEGLTGVLIGREGNRGVDGNRGITMCFSCVEDGGLCPVNE